MLLRPISISPSFGTNDAIFDLIQNSDAYRGGACLALTTEVAEGAAAAAQGARAARQGVPQPDQHPRVALRHYGTRRHALPRYAQAARMHAHTHALLHSPLAVRSPSMAAAEQAAEEGPSHVSLSLSSLSVCW
jgi:hypothetical protein